MQTIIKNAFLCPLDKIMGIKKNELVPCSQVIPLPVGNHKTEIKG